MAGAGATCGEPVTRSSRRAPPAPGAHRPRAPWSRSPHPTARGAIREVIARRDDIDGAAHLVGEPMEPMSSSRRTGRLPPAAEPPTASTRLGIPPVKRATGEVTEREGPARPTMAAASDSQKSAR